MASSSPNYGYGVKKQYIIISNILSGESSAIVSPYPQPDKIQDSKED
jgi:hypothetical protein